MNAALVGLAEIGEWVALEQFDAAHDVYTALVAAVPGDRTVGSVV